MEELHLAILPVGLKADELEVVNRVAQRLSIIAKNIKILKTIEIPQMDYNVERSQYLADDFLGFDTDLEYNRLLVITNVDLYSGNLNFVFGVAEMFGREAVISTYRLKADGKLFDERMLKEAVHELGHTLGLKHCPNPKCVMHFSECLEDTDIKDWKFCPRCSGALQRPF